VKLVFSSTTLILFHSFSFCKMKAAVLRSSRAALRPCTSRHLVGRSYSSTESRPERKVAILGAAGGIGQPLALLMKLNPLISSLSLYDIANTPGVGADVSHINSRAQVHNYC